MNKRSESCIHGKRASEKDALFRVCGAGADKLLIVLLLGSVCLFVLYPMVCILLRSFQGGGHFGAEAYRALAREVMARNGDKPAR